MEVAILVINYNDALTTVEFLDEVRKISKTMQIVVLDNMSSDSSFTELSTYKDEYTDVIQAPKNLGYGGGINHGVNYIRERYHAKYVIASNSDILFPEVKVFDELIKAMNVTGAGIVAPVIYEHSEKKYGWKETSAWYEGLCNMPLISRYFIQKKYYKEKDLIQSHSEIDMMSGCFFCLNVEIFECVGGFDPNVFLYYEENIIAKKLQRIGKKIVLCKDTYVLHNHSVSIDKSYSQLAKFDELKKSQLYYYEKYTDASKLSIVWMRLWGNLSRCIMKVRLNRYKR